MITNDRNDKKHPQTVVVAVREVLEAEQVSIVADTGYESVQDIAAGMGSRVAGTDYAMCLPAGEWGAAILGHKDARCVCRSCR